MPNFFLDNEDIRFLFEHIDMQNVARVQEEGYESGPDAEADYAPLDAADMVDNYRLILEITGDVAGNIIAPRADQIDREGHQLNEDGTVTLHPLVADNLDRLSQADLMGFTLPRKYGGINCPSLLYTMAIEIVSRADVSLMNIFGLQGIAETINAFADDEIKDEYLPRLATGEMTGAMVLTEPDAGSDLQAVRLRAFQDEEGNWKLRGVKRFITNGCGEVLLTLARSEPEMTDGRGLSLFISKRNERLKVRHLEHKLGIHGSPTCELVYDDVPAQLIGERQRGLITYVMALMNGARIGIAAQSLGVAEAAYRLARNYAHSRKQFGNAIENLPAVAEMVVDMRIALEAARAFVYDASTTCDLENNNLRMMESGKVTDKAKLKERKGLARTLKRLNGMLTPMAKYYASEMCIEVANTAIQVLGGSGYMTDYPAERYLRDARITTIYEGTSQLQIVAAVRGVCSGVFERRVGEFEEKTYDDPLLGELKEKLLAAKSRILEAVAYVKERGNTYMDLSGRRLVDSALTVLIGHLLLGQAAVNERKVRVVRRFLANKLPVLEMDCDIVCTGDTSAMEEYQLLAGPVPAVD